MALSSASLSRLMVLWTLAASVSGCATAQTASPRVDPMPIPGINLGDVLVRDDFNDPAANRFSHDVNQPGFVQEYARAEYHISLSSDFKPTSRLAGVGGIFGNTHVAVEARLAGRIEARFVSVACRLTMKDGKPIGFYTLQVFPATGVILLNRFEADRGSERWVTLIPSSVSESVHRGNATNHLELTCAGATILGRVNGILIGPAQDSTLATGHIALGTGRYEGGASSVDAWFDNFVVTEVLIGQ